MLLSPDCRPLPRQPAAQGQGGDGAYFRDILSKTNRHVERCASPYGQSETRGPPVLTQILPALLCDANCAHPLPSRHANADPQEGDDRLLGGGGAHGLPTRRLDVDHHTGHLHHAQGGLGGPTRRADADGRLVSRRSVDLSRDGRGNEGIQMSEVSGGGREAWRHVLQLVSERRARRKEGEERLGLVD